LRTLQVLRDDLALVALVVRDDAAEEEVGPVEARAGPAVVAEPGVHVGVELEEPHRVDVEYGLGQPFVPRHRVVARHREHVAEALGRELPASALERVAVPVLAGEVDHHLLRA
jgi:hypothetical protein